MELVLRHTRPRRHIGPSLTFVVAGLVVCAAACDKPPVAPEAAERPVGPVWFEDVTEASGLRFLHDAGHTGTHFTPQSMGSGAAAFDFDGDELLDVYLLNYGGPGSKSVNRLFRQHPAGKFTDVTDGSGLGYSGYCQGISVGDVNNDGRPDLVVTEYGGLRLFLNAGAGKFTDASEGSGLVNPLFGTSAGFLDFDRDGWLDLVVVNYLEFDPARECVGPDGRRDFCGPSNCSPIPTKVFRNLGPDPANAGRVRFADVSFACGVGRVSGPGLGLVCADLTGDGWPDIFVANDGAPNRLWVNRRDGTFTDEGLSRGVAYSSGGKAYAGMGVALGDADGDGLPDLFVTHMNTQTNTLWRQASPGQFRDHTQASGVAATRWRGTGFGTGMADFDLDGSPDLALVNGRVFRGGDAEDPALGFWETYAERNQIFANDGTGKFRDVSPDNPAFCGYWNVGRGLVCADFDGDGAPDLLTTSIAGRARLFRNVAPNRGHWLRVRGLDPRLNRDAHGAVVRVRAGGRESVGVVAPADSYLCAGPPWVQFGLGAAAAVEWVRVVWPDGVKEVFPGGSADRTVVVRRGEGNPS